MRSVSFRAPSRFVSAAAIRGLPPEARRSALVAPIVNCSDPHREQLRARVRSTVRRNLHKDAVVSLSGPTESGIP